MFRSLLIVLLVSFTFYSVAIDARCYDAEEIVSGLYNPLAVECVIDVDGRRLMLIAEHRGVIRSCNYATAPATAEQRSLKTFLDITDRVLTSARPMDERGLLGFALDPRFADNHHFFVFYSTATTLADHAYDHDSLVSRFRAKKIAGYWQAIKESELEIIRINQPDERQNGGQLFFAANDGRLYVTTGDGGDHNNARFKKNSLLGKILRIDVRNSTKSRRYSIPPDNPFVNDTVAMPEVYAYGFRNPWRCTVDYETIDVTSSARIFCGDLGEPGHNEEELNLVKPGGRYGWLDDPNVACHTLHECLTHLARYRAQHVTRFFVADRIRVGDYLPIHSYKHDEGQAIIGGIFYRGLTFHRLKNHYIYGDYVHGTFHTLVEDKSGNWLVQELCVAYFGDETAVRRRHILGIAKMEPDDILILTNTLTTNNESTGSIFKLKTEANKHETDTNNGHKSRDTACAMIILAVVLPIWLK